MTGLGFGSWTLAPGTRERSDVQQHRSIGPSPWHGLLMRWGHIGAPERRRRIGPPDSPDRSAGQPTFLVDLSRTIDQNIGGWPSPTGRSLRIEGVIFHSSMILRCRDQDSTGRRNHGSLESSTLL